VATNSVDDYIQELIANQAAALFATDARSTYERFNNLSNLLLNSPFAGANLDLERSKDYPRAVDPK